MSHGASCDAPAWCNDIWLWIQSDGGDGRPVADLTAPARWGPTLGPRVDGAALEQSCDVAPRVPIGRRDKPNRAVQMLRVIPVHEGLDPPARRGEIREGLRRIRRAVLQGAEERFGIRIVVAH